MTKFQAITNVLAILQRLEGKVILSNGRLVPMLSETLNEINMDLVVYMDTVNLLHEEIGAGGLDNEPLAETNFPELVNLALENGWEITQDGRLWLPGDISNNWCSQWQEILTAKFGKIKIPHYFNRRMKELNLIQS